MSRTTTACRRKHHRHRVAPGAGARVEFDYPQPHGAPCSVELADISLSGVSFRMPDALSGVEIGTNIAGVTIHVGRTALKGDLTVMHVTYERAICGALFYPATDLDLIQLRSMIAGIEAVESD